MQQSVGNQLVLTSAQERAVDKYVQYLRRQQEKDGSIPLPEYLYLGVSGVIPKKGPQDSTKVVVRIDLCDRVTRVIKSVSVVDDLDFPTDVVKLIKSSVVRGVSGSITAGAINNYFKFKPSGSDALGLYNTHANVIGDDGVQESGVELLMVDESPSAGKWSFRGAKYEGISVVNETANGGSITEYKFSSFTLKQFKEKASSLSAVELESGKWYFMTGVKRDAKDSGAFIITGYWSIRMESMMIGAGIVDADRLEDYKQRVLSAGSSSACAVVKHVSDSVSID